MNEQKITKDQVVRLAYHIFFFVVLTVAAAGLDLLAQWVKTLGVAEFTSMALSFSAHVMLVFDMVLFLLSLLIGGWNFLKEIRR